MPRESVAVTGVLSTYTQAGGTSGEPFHRRFCPGCGTPMLWEREGSPRVIILAGTLDDAGVFKPTENLFCDSAQDWLPLPPDMAQHQTYPPAA